MKGKSYCRGDKTPEDCWAIFESTPPVVCSLPTTNHANHLKTKENLSSLLLLGRDSQQSFFLAVLWNLNTCCFWKPFQRNALKCITSATMISFFQVTYGENHLLFKNDTWAVSFSKRNVCLAFPKYRKKPQILQVFPYTGTYIQFHHMWESSFLT